jgi:hypothetical protein
MTDEATTTTAPHNGLDRYFKITERARLSPVRFAAAS